MLFHKIKKGAQVKNSVSEFAYERRYKSEGWEIVETMGKQSAVAKSATLPPTAPFLPAEALKARLNAEAVVPAEAASEEPAPTETPEEAQAPEVAEAAQDKPQRGRPAKAKKQ